MDGSLAISIVAVLIAVGSLALAIRADRRAGRAESRGKRAQLAIEPRGSSIDRRGRRFELGLRNVGSGVAHAVRLWLEDEAGRVVSSVAGGEALAIVPGDDPVDVAVLVSEAALPPPPVSFSVLVSWSDGAGEHERANTGIAVST